MLNNLSEFYSEEGPERVGFIFPDGAIVEVENSAANPLEGFDVCAEDLITFAERATASWHTHPGASANLSVEDNSAFLCWPKLEHFIIGNDGIKKYVVGNNNRILQCAAA